MKIVCLALLCIIAFPVGAPAQTAMRMVQPPRMSAPRPAWHSFYASPRGLYRNSGLYRRYRHHFRPWRFYGAGWYPVPIFLGVGYGGGVGYYDSVMDYEAAYPAYQGQVGTDSPPFMQHYGLQQTDCGPANLVVVWSANGGVVCAYPTDRVPAGIYELDPSTLSLRVLRR